MCLTVCGSALDGVRARASARHSLASLMQASERSGNAYDSPLAGAYRGLGCVSRSFLTNFSPVGPRGAASSVVKPTVPTISSSPLLHFGGRCGTLSRAGLDAERHHPAAPAEIGPVSQVMGSRYEQRASGISFGRSTSRHAPLFSLRSSRCETTCTASSARTSARLLAGSARPTTSRRL
jgi:hypothetical protein